MLKKTFFTCLVVLLFSLTANSQITKGNWMVGGSGSYAHNTISNDIGTSYKSSIVSVKPNVGYFLLDKFVIGSSIGYYYSNFEDSSSSTFNIGAFARYYFLKPDKLFNLFTQAYYDFSFYETQSGSTFNGNGSIYGAKVGQVIFFNSSVGLEFTLGYERGAFDSNQRDTFQVGLGFQIHLEK